MTFSQPVTFQTKSLAGSIADSLSLKAMDTEEQREIDADNELAEYQACLSKPEEPNAVEPPSKKARTTTVRDIHEIPIKNLRVVKGKTVELLQIDGEPVPIDMTTPKPLWLTLPYGLETKLFGGGLPSFITGGAAIEGDRGFLPLQVKIPTSMLDIFASLEEMMQKDSKLPGKFHSALKDHIIKTKVTFTYNPTRFKIVVMEEGKKTVASGTGWKFLEPYAKDYRNFAGCAAKIVLRSPTMSSYKGTKTMAFTVDQLAIDTTVGDSKLEDRHDDLF